MAKRISTSEIKYPVKVRLITPNPYRGNAVKVNDIVVTSRDYTVITSHTMMEKLQTIAPYISVTYCGKEEDEVVEETTIKTSNKKEKEVVVEKAVEEPKVEESVKEVVVEEEKPQSKIAEIIIEDDVVTEKTMEEIKNNN